MIFKNLGNNSFIYCIILLSLCMFCSCGIKTESMQTLQSSQDVKIDTDTTTVISPNVGDITISVQKMFPNDRIFKKPSKILGAGTAEDYSIALLGERISFHDGGNLKLEYKNVDINIEVKKVDEYTKEDQDYLSAIVVQSLFNKGKLLLKGDYYNATISGFYFLREYSVVGVDFDIFFSKLLFSNFYDEQFIKISLNANQSAIFEIIEEYNEFFRINEESATVWKVENEVDEFVHLINTNQELRPELKKLIDTFDEICASIRIAPTSEL